MNRIIVKVDADLEDLIPGFLENRQKDILLLSEHVHNNNFETIKIIGHSMKGFGAGYGFMEISTIGAKLEQAAINSDSKEIIVQIEKLRDYMENIEISFEEL